MALNQQLTTSLDQKLVMTPQLQLAIKLLQMQATDLQGFIDQELMENPFLSSDDGASEREQKEKLTEKSNEDTVEAFDDVSKLSDDHLPDDMAFDNLYDSGTSWGTPSRSLSGDDDGSLWENTASQALTLKDHLNTQLGTVTQNPAERFIGAYLIDAIDDAGYIHLDFDKTAEKLGISKRRLLDVLGLIQTFDPAGVGARDLAECLRLQLHQNGRLTPAAAVVLQNLDLLARNDLKKLSRLCGASAEEVEAITKEIRQLTPKPGLQYGSDVATSIVPDVVLQYRENQWVAELNADALPKILLNKSCLGHRESTLDKNEKSYVSERMSRAQWLVKSLEQRARTIHKVANAIVKAQTDFFRYGVEALKPMTLKDIAEIAAVHESTVSRVTNGKYMLTPSGVFELKFFFNSAVNSTGGGMMIASESVKFAIKKLIEGESPAKPLSDQKLVKMLEGEGIHVARRTVAKYREALGIESSSGRRLR